MFSRTPSWSTVVCLARIVMPFSRSRSIESRTRSTTASFARNVPVWRSIASTSVVLPWSTWATIATFRRSERRARGVVSGAAGTVSAGLLGSMVGAQVMSGGHSRTERESGLVRVVPRSKTSRIDADDDAGLREARHEARTGLLAEISAGRSAEDGVERVGVVAQACLAANLDALVRPIRVRDDDAHPRVTLDVADLALVGRRRPDVEPAIAPLEPQRREHGGVVRAARGKDGDERLLEEVGDVVGRQVRPHSVGRRHDQ